MKVLFFGTPEVAVPFLEWLSDNEMVTAVITRPDEPQGRGYEVLPPPVKVMAEKKKIPVLQPQGPWTPETINKLEQFKADVGVAVAYGRILPQSVFGLPKLGTFNVHFSLLPKFRGAAPIQRALINGESLTGVTAFWMDEGMDSGPICLQEAQLISPEDNALTLKEKLISLGIKVLSKVMKDLAEGRVVRKVQKGDVIMAPQLKKEDGNIDWNRPAPSIVNLIRGVYEWPGATTFYQPKLGSPKALKIFSAEAREAAPEKKPGLIVDLKKDGGFVVQANPGLVLIKEVQPEGKKKMSAWSFWQGARLQLGDRLG